jgi:hypothetical protein
MATLPYWPILGMAERLIEGQTLANFSAAQVTNTKSFKTLTPASYLKKHVHRKFTHSFL